MKKINIKFGDKMFVVDEKTTLEDFLINEKIDTRNLATSVNADLILKHQRKHLSGYQKNHKNQIITIGFFLFLTHAHIFLWSLQKNLLTCIH